MNHASCSPVILSQIGIVCWTRTIRLPYAFRSVRLKKCEPPGMGGYTGHVSEAPLSSYLRRLDVNVQDMELDEKLMRHAFGRDDVKGRLRFIYEGLSRAVAWYRTQVVDKQMTADPELRDLLLELGEIDAAKLWLTEATMAMLRISTKPKPKDYSDQRRPEPQRLEGWQSRLLEDVGRPGWSVERPPRWRQPSRPRRKEQ